MTAHSEQKPGKYIPGDTKLKCFSCNKTYIGQQGSFHCERCAKVLNDYWDGLPPEQKDKLKKEANEFFSDFINNI